MSLTALLSPPLGEVGRGSGRVGVVPIREPTAKASPRPSPSRGRGGYRSYTCRAKYRSVRQSKATKSVWERSSLRRGRGRSGCRCRAAARGNAPTPGRYRVRPPPLRGRGDGAQQTSVDPNITSQPKSGFFARQASRPSPRLNQPALGRFEVLAPITERGNGALRRLCFDYGNPRPRFSRSGKRTARLMHHSTARSVLF